MTDLDVAARAADEAPAQLDRELIHRGAELALLRDLYAHTR